MLAENLFIKIGFDEKEISDFYYYDKLAGEECQRLADKYMSGEIDVFEAKKLLDCLETGEVKRNTYYLLFFVHSTAALYENYLKEGIDTELFYDTMKDMKYKLSECEKTCGVYGIRENSFLWYNGFFREYRHGFGRLQFDRCVYEGEPIERCGHIVFEGDFVLNCHIPSSGPLHHDDCIKAYTAAYEFFKDKLQNGILPVICSSWLLYPGYNDVFGRESNVCRFAADYRIIKTEETETFQECWRVFDKDFDGNIDALPGNTRMQRAFIEHMKNGGTYGRGRGILLFDGERILTKNQYLL